MSLGRLLLCSTAIAVLTGCSNSSSPHTAPAPASASASVPIPTAGSVAGSSNASIAHYDPTKVCALLSPADIKTATGQDVGAGAIGDQQPGLWVECRYYSGSDLVVRTQVATPDHATDAYQGNCEATDAATIAGADRACWDSGLGAVNVMKGGVEFDVIYSDTTAATDEAKTTALAAAALANIGRLD